MTRVTQAILGPPYRVHDEERKLTQVICPARQALGELPRGPAVPVTDLARFRIRLWLAAAVAPRVAVWPLLLTVDVVGRVDMQIAVAQPLPRR